MSTLRNPVGPEGPAVYWRRRLIFIAVVVAVVVILLLIVFRPGGGEPAPAPSDSPGTGASDTPVDPGGSSAEPGEVAACTPTSVRVVPVVDSVEFSNGEQPMLSMEVTNIGAAPCSYEVGTGAQEYVITSGADRIWSSRDCQQEPTTETMVLQPDVKLSTTPFAWDRTRSSADSCEGSRPEVIAGGASYHLSVRLGESESEDTFQFMLL